MPSVCVISWHNPDVTITHGIAVILQIDETFVRSFFDRGSGCGFGQFNIVVHNHAIQEDCDAGILNFFALCIITARFNRYRMSAS